MNPKAIITFFITAAFSLSFYIVSDPEKSVLDLRSKLYYTDDMTVPYRDIVSYDNYVYQLVPPPSDTIPYFSGFMDYATNGNSLKQLVCSGNLFIASATYVDSAGANDPNATSMRIIFNLSFDGGNTWVYPGRIPVSYDCKSRYGDLGITRLVTDSTEYLAGRFWNTPVSSNVRRAGVSWDVILGAATFNLTRLEGTSGYDLFGSRRLDNKLACVVKSPSFTSWGSDTLYYTTYDLRQPPYYSSLKVLQVKEMENSACAYTIAASPINSDHLTAVYCHINDHMVFYPAVIKVQTTTNGGNNWNIPFEISPMHTIDGDSSGCYWNLDAAYKPGTNSPYVVFSAYTNNPSPGAEVYRKSFKICIWNQTLNGGEPVVLADWRNIPILSNEVNFSRLRGFHVNSLALSHPSIGFKQDGSRIFVAYSVMQSDTNSIGFNYEDVYYQYSDNGGLNWTIPINMTNSVNAVEKYPIVPKTFPGNLPPVMYQWDQVPGCQSFNDNAPINRVYWVLKKDILVSSSVNEMVLPEKFTIHQNYPNPFNPSTKIRFELPAAGNVSIRIFDILGRDVSMLVNEFMKPGVYETDFNAADLPSGVYLYKLEAGEFTETRKMILLK